MQKGGRDRKMTAKKKINSMAREIEALLAYEKLSMMKRKAWGKLNFLAAKEDIHQILDIIDALRDMRLEALYDKDFKELDLQLQTIRKLFDRINKFDAKAAGAAKKRETLLKEIKDTSGRFHVTTLPWVKSTLFF